MTKPDLISPWTPESNALIHQAIGKLGEEAAELSSIAFRCLIQGFKESEPVTGKSNRQALQEEISDVIAALYWLKDVAAMSSDPARVDRKYQGFKRWEALILNNDLDPTAGTSGYTPRIIR